MPSRASRAAAIALTGLLLLAPAPGHGEAPQQADRIAVEVRDVDGKARALPDPAKPILLVYEDRKSERQNEHVFPILTKVRRPENAGKIELVAVADVEAYDFWPAKQFVIAHVRRAIKKDGSPIYLDWRGAVRRELGLAPGRSAFVLLAPDGTVRWTGQGALTAPQQAQLIAELQRAGVSLD